MISKLVAKVGNVLGTVNRQTVTALDEWLTFLGGPQDPPFSAGASFPRGEWSRFFRLLTISLALTGAVLGIDSLVLPGGTGKMLTLNALQLKLVVGFALAGIPYSVYAKAFRIAITGRQSFFCISFVVLPWLPVLAMIKLAGRYLGFLVLFLCANGAILRIGFLLSAGIRVVTGASMFRVAFSLLLGIAIVVASVLSMASSSPSN
jgi:hypothetical protein